MNRHKAQIWRWQKGSALGAASDELAPEEPLEIRVDTRSVSITMRTPGHDDELAAGFLFSEGLLHSSEQILNIAPYPRNKSGNVIDVFLQPEVKVDFARLTRHVFASSSCGLCGKATIEALHQQWKPVRKKLKIKAETLLTLPEELHREQNLFATTGGLHAAGLFTASGDMVALREDVGRHNAVDKLVGYGVLGGKLPFNKHVLLVSGRASFELVQKALAAGIPIVASISAPSSLAVELAGRSGQTLVGFLRDKRMNVYSHPERIRFK